MTCPVEMICLNSDIRLSPQSSIGVDFRSCQILTTAAGQPRAVDRRVTSQRSHGSVGRWERVIGAWSILVLSWVRLMDRWAQWGVENVSLVVG